MADKPKIGDKPTVGVPPNSQAGQRLRVKGKGLHGAPQGDKFAILTLVMPPTNSEESQIVWANLADTAHFDPRLKWGI